MDVELIDNFLPEENFKLLVEAILSQSFPFYHQDYITNSTEQSGIDHVNFTHLLHFKTVPASTYYPFVYENFISKISDLRSIIRSKVNCYPRTDKNVLHAFHQDFLYPHRALILSLNTCDGYTVFEDGTKIDSISNRAVIFDASVSHASTSCTNQKCRWNIIVNYF